MTPEEIIAAAGLTDYPRLMSVSQYAEAVRVHWTTAYEHVRRGEVPVVMVGCRKRVSRWALAHKAVFGAWPAAPGVAGAGGEREGGQQTSPAREPGR